MAATLQTVLQPFARMLVRRGIGARTVAEITKRAYVAATIDVLHERELPVTAARLSVFTGLTRREIEQAQQSLSEPDFQATDLSELSSLLTTWHEDSLYSVAFTGTPSELDFEGPANKPSFSRLVRECAPNHSPKDVLSFLVGTGAARINEESGRIQAISRAFISEPYSEAAVKRFERMVRNLIDTFYSNFQTVDGPQRRFNRNAIADFPLTPGSEEAFRQHVQVEGQRFLEALDKWLKAQDPAEDNGRRVGVALFHFVEPRERGETGSDTSAANAAQPSGGGTAQYEHTSTDQPNQDVIDVLNYQGPKV
ncbi:MAG: DUF6502 family protein [Steroidobacteraceae bacterium]